MTKPMLLADFARLPPVTQASVAEGLSAAIDAVADHAPASHRFLRYGWYAAALATYDGRARTAVVERDRVPVIALPFVPLGPAWLRLAGVPGSYWPFRGFPANEEADAAAYRALLSALGQAVRGVRIGPVPDVDPAVTPLLAAARGAGWAVLDRVVATGWLLDLTQRDWPRGSTLKKNRFHEKHLAAHGALDWRFLTGADWPAAFDPLAEVETRAWARTSRDAKFTASGRGAFWRAAATDPALAAMFSAALLTIDGRPAAFSFDLDAGDTRYAIANSYDPAFARHSPGKLLQYRNLLRAREAGLRTVDWGMGDSGYKQTLGAVEGPALRDWLLLRPGLPALARRVIRRAWARSGQTRT